MTEAKCFPSCIWFTASKAGTRRNIWHERADFYYLDFKNREQFKSGFFILLNDGTFKFKNECFCKGLVAKFRHIIQIIVVRTSLTGYAILPLMLKLFRRVCSYMSVNIIFFNY